MVVVAALSALVPLAVVVAVVLAMARAVRGDGDADWTTLVRQFFQHLVAAILAVVAAGGLSRLLALALSGPGLLDTDQALAVPVTFTLVGVPLYLVMAWWLLRVMDHDRVERESVAWALHLAGVGVGSVVVAMVGAWQLAGWALGDGGGWATPVANLVVWGGLWVGYRVVDRHLDTHLSILHVIAGSAVGLLTWAVAAHLLLTRVVEDVVGRAVVVDTSPASVLVALVLGAAVWTAYWVLDGVSRPRDAWWYGWVLLGPMLQGLLVALGGAAVVLHGVLVGLVGNPGGPMGAQRVADLAPALAAAFVGAVVVVVHRAVLVPRTQRTRTEVDRVHDLLLAAVGLGAAAGGFATVVVAIVEAVTGSGALARGPDPVNTLLAALTLLVLGVPVWWRAWGRSQRLAARPAPTAGAGVPAPNDPGRAERRSPARRVYLVGLFGIGALVAVASLLVGVVGVFEDVFSGRLGAETVFDARIGLSLLVTAGGVALLHAASWRRDRDADDPRAGADGGAFPAHVTLVGVADGEVVARLRAATDARVELWRRDDGVSPSWDVDGVTGALAGNDAAHVLVLAGPAGFEVIPVAP